MCVFCEIVKGNIPSAKVYEDDDFLAILDLSQTTLDHTLVMPKKHYENVLEMPKEEAEALMGKAQEVAKLLTEKLHPAGMNILLNCNEAAGQSVMHTHVHLIPRYDESDGIEIHFHESGRDLNEVLAKIKG
ncbi:MAG: HIT family protein [Erysipelotrichaceae bacterium]|nr:HIT family protein [Erysipelotrichaceae bacterium]